MLTTIFAALASGEIFRCEGGGFNFQEFLMNESKLLADNIAQPHVEAFIAEIIYIFVSHMARLLPFMRSY